MGPTRGPGSPASHGPPGRASGSKGSKPPPGPPRRGKPYPSPPPAASPPPTGAATAASSSSNQRGGLPRATPPPPPPPAAAGGGRKGGSVLLLWWWRAEEGGKGRGGCFVGAAPDFAWNRSGFPVAPVPPPTTSSSSSPLLPLRLSQPRPNQNTVTQYGGHSSWQASRDLAPSANGIAVKEEKAEDMPRVRGGRRESPPLPWQRLLMLNRAGVKFDSRMDSFAAPPADGCKRNPLLAASFFRPSRSGIKCHL